MSVRGLVILAVLLVAAVAGLVWMDRRNRQDAGADDGALVLEVRPDDVRSIDIEGGPESVRLELDEGDRWVLTGEDVVEADARRVRELLDVLTGLRVSRTVDENAADMSAYGLDPPEIVATLSLGERTEPVRLRMGRASPVGYQRYVALGDSRRVALVDGSLVTALDRPADSFHEMRLFPVEAESVRRIVIDRSEGRIAIEHSGTTWRVTEPVADRGDVEGCERLARALTSLRFARFSPASRRPGAGRLRVELTTAGVPGPRIGWVDASDSGGERAAGREPEGPYGYVDDALARDIEVGLEDLRDKDLASFSTPDVREISWTIDGETVELRRTEEGAPWTESAVTAPRIADSSRVESLLNAVRWLRATDFAPVARLGPEEGRLRAAGEGGTIVELSWGRLGDSDRRWVTSSQREGLTGVVRASTVDDIARRASELAE